VGRCEWLKHLSTGGSLFQSAGVIIRIMIWSMQFIPAL
jgi:hypothetical protein